MAIFPYEAQQDDELSFPADAILEILDPENASGWFKARLGDQVGLIPSTYLQPIDAHNQCKYSYRFIFKFNISAQNLTFLVVLAMYVDNLKRIYSKKKKSLFSYFSRTIMIIISKHHLNCSQIRKMMMVPK
jgi:hypothetical protein